MVILNNTVWQILTLLFQRTVAGIIVLFVTRKLQERKDRELLRRHALFVGLEIHGHIAMLEDMLKHNAIPQSASNTAVFFDCHSWKSSQSYLALLSIQDLTLIGAYYQSAMTLNTIIPGYAGQPLNPHNKFSVAATLEMGRRVHAILESHWKG